MCRLIGSIGPVLLPVAFPVALPVAPVWLPVALPVAPVELPVALPVGVVDVPDPVDVPLPEEVQVALAVVAFTLTVHAEPDPSSALAVWGSSPRHPDTLIISRPTASTAPRMPGNDSGGILEP